jgi:RNA polymerase sigma-70 factor, ECF subfamily
MSAPADPVPDPGMAGIRRVAPTTLDDFGQVYAFFYQDVYRAVRAIVLDPMWAEDLTQDVFVKAYAKREQYRPIGSLGGWLHRIAVREAISGLRWRTLQTWLIGSVGQLSHAEPDPWLGHLVAEGLAALRPKARAAIVLHHYYGYRYNEIAEMLGVPPGTVATRIANGLRTMRRVLQQGSEESALGRR